MLDQLALVLIGAFLASIGWFLRRRITGSHKDEKVARIDKALDLKERLQRNGMTIKEGNDLVDRLFTGPTSLDDASFLLQTNFTKLDTNAALGAQLDARLRTLESEMAETFLKIEILTDDEDYFDSLQAAQKAWLVFRDAEGVAAATEMAGGTGSTVNSLGAQIFHTEKRMQYLNELLESMKNM